MSAYVLSKLGLCIKMNQMNQEAQILILDLELQA